MNTYEITFTRENGTAGSDRFTAPSEAQARRDFKEVYRHSLGTITNVELVSENVPATKEQERKAVEKIRKIVEELGEGSYVGTALDGCLQDAEINIENDFGDSMKSRWEYSEKKLVSAREEIEEQKAKMNLMQETIDELRREQEASTEREAAIREKAISPDDLDTLLALAIERIADLDCEVQNAAERIVESAGEPESAAFKNAVSDHRSAKRAADKYKALVERAARAKQ